MERMPRENRTCELPAWCSRNSEGCKVESILSWWIYNQLTLEIFAINQRKILTSGSLLVRAGRGKGKGMSSSMKRDRKIWT
jgi:hypothetical protein